MNLSLKVHKVALLKGGTSEEREVSIHTCNAVEKALRSLHKEVLVVDPSDFVEDSAFNYMKFVDHIKKSGVDIVFIGLHGGDGEDGTFQKLFELAGIPFVGSSSEASYISMNKKISKLLAQNLGVPVPKALYFRKNGTRPSYNEISAQLGQKLVIKPNASGSSFGVTILNNTDGFDAALKLAFSVNDDILIEEYIPGREITVAMLGNEALPVVEIKPSGEFYDYTHKYTDGYTVYETPAKLTQKEAEVVLDYGEKIYKEFKCSDYVRVDFRFDGKEFYFLELNTLPGMTSLSLVPMAAKVIGISFEELVRKLIERDFE